MSSLLQFCPLELAPDSVAAWLWQEAARDGENAVGQTVCRALGPVRLAARAQQLDEWQPVFDYMQRHFAGEDTRDDAVYAHDDLQYPDLDEDHPAEQAWRAGDLLAEAFNLATALGRNGDWWADCASIVKWSMQAAELATSVLGLSANEAIAICVEALHGSKLAERAATHVAERRELYKDAIARLAAWTPADPVADLLAGLGVSRARVAEARMREVTVVQWWTTTDDPSDQLSAALRAFRLPASRRVALLTRLAQPLVDELPAQARLARSALATGASDRVTAFALAMGVMLEAFLVASAVENGQITHAGPGNPALFPSAVWHTGEVCALIALECAATELDRDLPHELAKHLARASLVMFDPHAARMERHAGERLAGHTARLADRVRECLPARELVR